MRLFSSRRESITAELRGRAARFEQHYGRAPSQRELAQLGQASDFATRKGKEGAGPAGLTDWDMEVVGQPSLTEYGIEQVLEVGHGMFTGAG